jgi:DNA replication protein DnaC
MHTMKLRGMAAAFQKAQETGLRRSGTTPDEFIGLLVDAEWEERQNRRLRRFVRKAKFRYQAGFEELDFTLKRNLDKDMVMRLSDSSWVQKAKNVIITGATGVGKSFLASALGYQACLDNFKTLYFNCLKLFSQLKRSQADHSYEREIRRIQRSELVILDDFGLQPLDSKDRMSLLEILEDRHGKCSTVVVTQIPVSKWHDVIGDSTVADAICDRLVHSSLKIDMKGESVRKTMKT